MIVYKLTDRDGVDGDRRWNSGAAYHGTTYAYSSPSGAAMFGPAFDPHRPARLWMASTNGATATESGVRLLCHGLTTLGEMTNFRQLTPAQHVGLALECVAGISPSVEFVDWTGGWLCDGARDLAGCRRVLERLGSRHPCHVTSPGFGVLLVAWRLKARCVEAAAMLALDRGERAAARAAEVMARLAAMAEPGRSWELQLDRALSREEET